MNALFEMQIRVGGDPRGYAEFTALREELAKLGHPARPDVDWHTVERLCLMLFQQNGAELQTASFYALARSQRRGVEGMLEGVRLLKTLSGDWPRLWPTMASVRLDMLEWLFGQLQPLLRSLALTTSSVPALVQLDTALAGLNDRLVRHTAAPLLRLQALRQQLADLTRRLECGDSSGETALLPVRVSEPAFVLPMLILPPPDMGTGKRRVALWVCAGTMMVALAIGLTWRAWLAGPGSERVLPDTVRLDSLSLFDAGSAQLNPGSTRVLIDALVNIKARPGWLIVIAGHTDATGVAEQNRQLSQARASAVRDWMQGMGNIAPDCFAVQGFAASQPVASNETEAGRIANRRVEIRLVPQAGACEPAAAGTAPGR